MNWDQLRTFEAVARLGSLTSASASLGVSQSTVSRHLSRLESEAGSPLLLRESPVRLTERGVALLEAVRPMVDSALAARSAIENTPVLRGQVTLTSVGELVRWELAERLPSFYRSYPHLGLRILTDNRVASLAAGDADVALRWVRPERGDLVARRLHTETYTFAAASTLELSPDVPWLGLAGSLEGIPEQRHAVRAFATRSPRLLVEDVETLGLVVQAGLGVAILPSVLIRRLTGVVPVVSTHIGAREVGDLPSRDLYRVVHRSRQHLPKVRALVAWLDEWAS